MDVDNENQINENNFKDYATADGVINWMPSSLDIRFGNLCNQKCIMCSPTYSNLWYDEFVEYHHNTVFGNGKQVKLQRDFKTGKWKEPEELKWFEDPRWWPKFESMMPYLKHIYITGGEPMVTPAHDIMLDKLIEAGFAKNIRLEYDTNCSAVNDKIAQRWFHFKQVHIRGSMDAINDQYELIRFPGNWDKFQKNVKKLQEYEAQSNNSIRLLALTTCFQIATSYSIIESEEWCKSIGVDFHLRFLEGPQRHSVASLSDTAKEKLIEYYTPYIDSSVKAKMILSYLKNHMGENFYKEPAVADFVKFMDFLDKSRSTNWRKTFPEVSILIGNI